MKRYSNNDRWMVALTNLGFSVDVHCICCSWRYAGIFFGSKIRAEGAFVLFILPMAISSVQVTAWKWLLTQPNGVEKWGGFGFFEIHVYW